MRKRKGHLTYEPSGYLFIAPYYLFFLVFVVFPILVNIFLSFTNFNLKTYKFIGFSNYLKIPKDTFFIKSIENTIIYVFWTILINIILGLLLALVMNRKGIWLRGFFRATYYLPYVTSMAAISMIWLWLFEPSGGFMNAVLHLFRIPSQTWLYDENLALGCIIFMTIWKNLGYYMTIYLAGLTGIPNYLYEAAMMDGATPFQQFVHITVPMLKPITFFLLITGTANAFNVFEQVNVMTGGGPMNATTTIVHQIYTRSFTEYKLGYGAAQAIVLFLIVLVFALLNFRYGNQGQDLDIG